MRQMKRASRFREALRGLRSVAAGRNRRLLAAPSCAAGRFLDHLFRDDPDPLDAGALGDVHRLDDLADDDPGKRQVTDLIEGGGPKTNGFALVTVDPDKPANSQVTVELIDIPVDGRLVRTPSPSPTTTPTAAANH